MSVSALCSGGGVYTAYLVSNDGLLRDIFHNSDPSTACSDSVPWVNSTHAVGNLTSTFFTFGVNDSVVNDVGVPDDAIISQLKVNAYMRAGAGAAYQDFYYPMGGVRIKNGSQTADFGPLSTCASTTTFTYVSPSKFTHSGCGINTSSQIFSATYATDPFTSAAWSLTNILSYGYGGVVYYEAFPDGGPDPLSEIWCSGVWVELTYTIPPINESVGLSSSGSFDVGASTIFGSNTLALQTTANMDSVTGVNGGFSIDVSSIMPTTVIFTPIEGIGLPITVPGAPIPGGPSEPISPPNSSGDSWGLHRIDIKPRREQTS